MAKYTRNVKCIDFNSAEEVSNLLLYLKNKNATIIAFDQKKPGFNTFAILTKYREKEFK